MHSPNKEHHLSFLKIFLFKKERSKDRPNDRFSHNRLPLDQVPARDLGDRLDGWPVLLAQTVRVSCRGNTGGHGFSTGWV